MKSVPEYGCNAGLSHSAALEQLHSVLAQIRPQDVANAFLYSLSTRALEYRSALGSFYYAKAIPDHKSTDDWHCYLCGWYKNGSRDFCDEREKYGGIQHSNLDYALFDLEQFLKLPKVVPTQADVRILQDILACIGELDPVNKAGKLRDLISKKKIFKTNKKEITTILEILGICGILASEAHPGYEKRFADEYDRAPTEHTNDMQYPLNHWRAKDGINASRFAEVFGFPLICAMPPID